MLKNYLKKLAHLRTDSGRDRYPATTCHRAPHKPLLLLAVMDHIAEGVITENFIRPTLDLVDTFNTFTSLVLPAGWKTSMAHPFPRLQSDGFWHRIPNPGYDAGKDHNNVTPIAKLRTAADSPLEVSMKNPVSIEKVAARIYFIRGQKVMLDRDLAELYGVETRVLKQAVKRNIARFPVDFMFELSRAEFDNLRSQIVISSWGGIRYRPMAFTEQGVAMLSSVLNSERAIQVNIQIMRTFTKLRQMLATHEDLRRKIEAMEQKYDQQFQVVFDAIKLLLEAEEKPKPKIGFTVKERIKAYGRKRG